MSLLRTPHFTDLRYLLLSILLLACIDSLHAQTEGAPDFICTRSEAGDEVLTWRNPVDFCGDYLGTEIYRASSASGPYSLVVTLADSTTTEYRDPNPTGDLLYYYLRYVDGCPTFDPPTSDTLDSFIPQTPDVRYLSVENGGLRISWNPSVSPEVSGYAILEVTPTGIVPLDTVGAVTDYQITGVPADELTLRQYRVVAIDRCGNDSPQSRIVSATGLLAQGGRDCDTDIRLRGDDTADDFVLSEPVADAELYASVDGTPFERVDYTAAPDGQAIVFERGQDGQNICFFVLTRLVAGDSVLTDTVCRTIRINPILPEVQLYGAEFDDTGRLIVKHSAGDLGPLLAEATLQVGGAGQQDGQRIPLSPTDFSPGRVTVSVPILPERGIAVLLDLFDECGNQVVTNVASPIFLAARSLFTEVLLNWLPVGNDGLPGTTRYTVLYQQGDSLLFEIASGIDELSYTDFTTGTACYRIVGNFTPADRDTTLTFRSNIACAVEEARVYIPNVFRPAAQRPENRIFRPILTTLTGVTNYSLRVYNRWGGLSFETDDPLSGWAGNVGGQAAPAGAYLFHLSFLQDGNLRERTGVVQLMY
jgi:hypothetical protein